MVGLKLSESFFFSSKSGKDALEQICQGPYEAKHACVTIMRNTIANHEHKTITSNAFTCMNTRMLARTLVLYRAASPGKGMRWAAARDQYLEDMVIAWQPWITSSVIELRVMILPIL